MVTRYADATRPWCGASIGTCWPRGCIVAMVCWVSKTKNVHGFSCGRDTKKSRHKVEADGVDASWVSPTAKLVKLLGFGDVKDTNNSAFI